jgi:hypothetical protein
MGGSVMEGACGGDPGWGLVWQIEFEFFQEQFLVGLGLGVAAEDEGAPVGGRKRTSSICMAANLSRTAREVSPGAWAEVAPAG